MSPPLFLVGDVPTELPGRGAFRLNGLRGSRAARGRGLSSDDVVLLGDGQGGTASAVVASVGGDHLDLVVGVAEKASRPGAAVAVVQWVDSPDRDALAVAELTELGAAEIAPLASLDVLRVLEAGVARWRAVAREAAERAGLTWLPRIGAMYHYLSLLRRFEWGATGLLLDPAVGTPLSTVDVQGEVVLVAGCLAEEEMSVLASHYVTRVSHGEFASCRDAAVAAMRVLRPA